jgi:hypothetical protein
MRLGGRSTVGGAGASMLREIDTLSWKCRHEGNNPDYKCLCAEANKQQSCRTGRCGRARAMSRALVRERLESCDV